MSKIAEIGFEDGKIVVRPEPGAPFTVVWSDGGGAEGTTGSVLPTSPVIPDEPEPAQPNPSVTDMFPEYDCVVDAAMENDKSPGTGHRNRAVSMGLNKYPGCPLSGCVNDSKDILNFAVRSKVFTKAQIRISTDEQNTTEGMLQRMRWALEDVKPGDVRLIHYSGHGAQYAGDGHGFQPDHQHDVLCPIDFDWSEDHMIMDVQLFELFKAIPAGAHIWVLSDSCHSGRLVRELGNPIRPNKPRAYPFTPSHVKARLAKAQANVHRALIGQTLDIGFGSGCRYDQTSADTSDEHGRPCGAFTHYLLRALATGATKPFAAVIKDVNDALAHNGYEQRPQATCARANRPFLG